MSKLGRFLRPLQDHLKFVTLTWNSKQLVLNGCFMLFQLDDEPNHKINNGCLGFQLHNKLGEHFSSFFL